MKRRMLTWTYALSYYTGILKLFYFLNRKKQIVIAYHNIFPDHHFDETLVHIGVISTSLSSFLTQIKIIVKRFKVVTTVEKRTCMITFDDGYHNNFQCAAPALEAIGIRGVFFIPACYFEMNGTLWVDKLLMWVSYVPPGQYTLLGKTHLISTTDSRHQLWSSLYDAISKNMDLVSTLLEETNQHYTHDRVQGMIDSDLYALRFQSMAPEDIEQLQHHGHRVGCHSFNHPILSALNIDDVEADFERCLLHQHKYNTLLYSYPFGDTVAVTEREINLAKTYGYTHAYVNCMNTGSNMHALGRICLGNLTNNYCIEARLSGFEHFLKRILRAA